MEHPPLTSVIEIDGKSYQIETSYVGAKQKVLSVIQVAGRVISQRETDLADGMSEDAIRHFLQEIHRTRSVELESVFRLSRKIFEKPAADTCTKMGVVLLANGFYDEAVQKFTKAIEMDPNHLQAMKNYGVTLTLLEDYDGAIAMLNRARELGPGYADVFYHLGNVHLYRRELDDAVQNYLQALQINPRYADAHLKLAAACMGYLLQSGTTLPDSKVQELCVRAKQESDTAASLNPKLRNRSFLMAQDYLRNKKYSLSFQQFMDVRPKYVPRIGDEIIFFFTLTLLYGSEGIDLQMTEQYVDKLTTVIEEYPHYADLHHHLGVAYLIKARFDVNRSMKEFKKALEINPKFQKALDQSREAEELHKNTLMVLRKAIIQQNQ
jgi:tetratricopeptide (TPR) repeat protein